MYKIAVIGDRDSVLGFMALGFSVYEVENSADAAKILNNLAKSNLHAIIYITEQFAMQIEDEIAKYKDNPLPAIICIPNQKGTTGYGIANVKKAVERAVGADILFKD